MPDHLFQEKDPRGITVVCSKRTWDEHIINHSSMKGNVVAVQETISSPNVIVKSAEREDRDVYFKTGAVATYGSRLYTKVVVQISGDKGEVVTAFPTRHIEGNIDEGDFKYVNYKNEL